MNVKRTGIINAQLIGALAALRHTDTFVISDAGFPIPRGLDVVDLSVVYGQPTSHAVLMAILPEVVVEGAWVATEMADFNMQRLAEWRDSIDSIEQIPHDQLKQKAHGAKFCVHSGDNSPYSNIVLRAGIPFA